MIIVAIDECRSLPICLHKNDGGFSSSRCSLQILNDVRCHIYDSPGDHVQANSLTSDKYLENVCDFGIKGWSIPPRPED